MQVDDIVIWNYTQPGGYGFVQRVVGRVTSIHDRKVTLLVRKKHKNKWVHRSVSRQNVEPASPAAIAKFESWETTGETHDRH